MILKRSITRGRKSTINAILKISAKMLIRRAIRYSDGLITLTMKNRYSMIILLVVINSISQHLIKIQFLMNSIRTKMVFLNFQAITSLKNDVGSQINISMILRLTMLSTNMVLVMILHVKWAMILILNSMMKFYVHQFTQDSILTGISDL